MNQGEQTQTRRKGIYLMEIIELIKRVPVWICLSMTSILISKKKLKYRKEHRREKDSWMLSLMA